MYFLVLLLVLWIEKFSAWRRHIQQDDFWLRELARAEANPRMSGRPWAILALLVLLPLVLLALVLLAWSRLPMAGWRCRCTCW